MTTVLDTVRNLMEAGEDAAALESLNELIETDPNDASHTLRLALIADKVTTNADYARYAADTLKYFGDDMPNQAQAPYERIVEAVNQQLDKIERDLDGDATPKSIYETCQTLEPLAPHFLRLLLYRARAIIKLNEQSRSSLFNRFSNRNRDQNNSDDNPPVRQALDDLETLVDLVGDGHPLYNQAAAYLPDVYRKMSRLFSALTWFARAEQAGHDLHQDWQATAKDALKRILEVLDKDLETKDRSVFDKIGPIESLPEVQARLADLALINGELQTAEAHYRTIQQAEPSAIFSRELLIGIESVGFEIGTRVTSPSSFGRRFGSPFGNPFQRKDEKEDDAEPEIRRPVDKYGFPRGNLRLYALAGLIEIADQRGDSTTVRDLIYTMLDDRQIPAAQNDRLLMRLDSLESDVETQRLEAVRAELAEAVKAGAWDEAHDVALTLVNLSGAEPGDFVWLAACMARRSRPAEAIAQVLSRVPPSAISALPKAEARRLLDALTESGYWDVADRYVEPLQTAKKWWADYQARRADYLSAELKTARDRLAAGNVDEAERIAERLLLIAPDFAPATLVLARVMIARRHWSTARTLLTPLEGQPALQENVQRLLTEVDVAEGHLNRAQERLKSLDEAATATALARRMAHMPHIAVRPAESTVSPDTLGRRPADDLWNAFFAVRLSGVHVAKRIPSIQQQTAEFLIGLHRVDQYLAQPHFVWRYIGREGRLTIALICRVEAHTESAATTTAQSIWRILRQLLPLQEARIYTYEPVIHPDELAYLLEPLPVQAAAQVVRDEPATAALGDDFYRVSSFGVYAGPMHRMLRMIAEHPGGAVVETYFHPTDVYPWERRAIEDMLSDSGDEPDFRRMRGQVMVQLEKSAGYQSAAKVYQELTGSLQTLPFIVQTRITAPNAIDPALPEMVGLELFGASSYRVQTAYTTTDVDAARQNLTAISGERWGYTAAPNGLERWRYLLTPMEALTAARLPTPGPDGLPGVSTLKVRVAPLPGRLPRTGAVLGESVTPVRGEPLPIHLTDADRLRHAYVVGRTGTGKSTLLQNMTLQDIEAGRGVGIIDPHGDLVENLLSRIPAHRRHDVILFDPSDVDKPIGLNILDVQGAYAQSVVISDFIGLLYTLFDPNRIGMIGPRFENAVRNSMLTAMEIQGSTFVEVVRIMTDKKFREECLKIITDPVVKSYWTDVASDMARLGNGDMLDYVTSKFGRFINDRLMRNIIGQSRNSLNLQQIMNDGKILLVNLAKGKIGPESSHFLGLILMPQIFVAALSRARLREDDRRLFCLYVDEFHNFTTPAFSTMLAEARKYGVALTVANQFISQLTPSIREAVFGNVGTLLSFRVGIKDAQFLAQEFYPTYDENDLINLPNFYMLAKLLVNGDAVSPFPVRTLPDNRRPDYDGAEVIRSHSQTRYGRDERVVNLEIRQRYENPPRRR